MCVHAPHIDPQSALGGAGPLLALDQHDIYGTDIYVLWNDKCQRDVRKMIMALRGVQLGHLLESRLREIAGDQTRSVDLTRNEWDELNLQVCSELTLKNELYNNGLVQLYVV